MVCPELSIMLFTLSARAGKGSISQKSNIIKKLSRVKSVVWVIFIITDIIVIVPNIENLPAGPD
jgi:hypothetical protein